MSTPWELTILDADVPTGELGGVAAGDVDGDGNVEVTYNGKGVVLWYRPATRQRGIVARMGGHVGAALHDIDGDGRPELVLGDNPSQAIYWFKPPKVLKPDEPWPHHLIDDHLAGAPHDVVFGDIDGDGKAELVVDAVYSGAGTPGVYAYKQGADVHAPWQKVQIDTGRVLEGTAIADVDGDGQAEIICGPDYFHCPKGGAFSGAWQRHTFAPWHREMCRAAAIDITGTGRPDLVLVDSEYLEGRLSWFENRLREDPAHPWIEHVIEDDLVYAHSLAVWRDRQGCAHVMVGEMGQGGWHAPPNRKARIIEYVTANHGKSWDRQLVSHGEGSHEDLVYDIDGDGELEIVGKDPYENVTQDPKEDPYGKCVTPRVHFLKKAAKPSPLQQFRHRFIDRDKPHTAIDIFPADLDGDGQQEIVCGRWWYRLDDGVRHELPGICQAICAWDLDGDGKLEVIGIKPKPGEGFYAQLTSELVWLKCEDRKRQQWAQYAIGTGHGDWPHGNVVAPLLPGGQLALVTGYHDAGSEGSRPQIWSVPADPRQPWPVRILADLRYGEEFVACDIDGDGKLDLVAGSHWLENLGDGTFVPHKMVDGFKAARVAVADFSGDGRPDVLLGEEVMDFNKRVIVRSSLLWLENPQDPRRPWTPHIIDKVRCAHSVAAADLDGDGQAEVVCGEHDPFWPYRSMCNTYVYKKADARGLAWKRYCLDNRFEHHDGTKIIDLGGGRKGIISHGWTDSIYVHLWEPS